jgi:hypothetical protein
MMLLYLMSLVEAYQARQSHFRLADAQKSLQPHFLTTIRTWKTFENKPGCGEARICK